ncbi:hypothetical protein KUCAC02_031620, partial [Chaenocephalus aceratus]
PLGDAPATPATRSSHTGHSLQPHRPLAPASPATRSSHTGHSLQPHRPLAPAIPATRSSHTGHSLQPHTGHSLQPPATRSSHTGHSLQPHRPLAPATPATRSSHTGHSLQPHRPLAPAIPATRSSHTGHSLKWELESRRQIVNSAFTPRQIDALDVCRARAEIGVKKGKQCVSYVPVSPHKSWETSTVLHFPGDARALFQSPEHSGKHIPELCGGFKEQHEGKDANTTPMKDV